MSEVVNSEQEIIPEIMRQTHIYEALAKAQAQFQPIIKNAEGQIGNLKFSYATLDAVLDATLPALNAEGIFVNWTIEDAEFGKNVFCWLHLGEQSISCKMPAYHPSTMADMGKAITYARRYGYQCLIGVIGEEDTDAQELDSSKPENPKSKTNGEAKRAQQSSKGQQSKTTKQTEKPAEPTCPPLNTWKKRIDQATAAADLEALITKAAEFEPLVANAALLQEVGDYLADTIRGYREAETWSAEDCERLSKHLAHQWTTAEMQRESTKPQLNMETITKNIEACGKPEGLIEYLEKASKSEKLLANTPLLKQLLNAAGKSCAAKNQSGQWTDEHCDRVDAKIASIFKQLETPQTQGELLS